MTGPSAPLALTAHLALLSSISFGGFPTVLPDVRNFVVVAHGWMTDHEFASLFAMAQSIPGAEHDPDDEFHRVESMGISWNGGQRVCHHWAPCTMYFAAYQLWDRFRDAPWQPTVRRGLVPVVVGLVIASGLTMAQAADTGWELSPSQLRRPRLRWRRDSIPSGCFSQAALLAASTFFKLISYSPRFLPAMAKTI